MVSGTSLASLQPAWCSWPGSRWHLEFGTHPKREGNWWLEQRSDTIIYSPMKHHRCVRIQQSNLLDIGLEAGGLEAMHQVKER